MQETLTVISLILGIVSVALIIILNVNTIKKVKEADNVERLKAGAIKLGEQMESSPFGILVLKKLDDIQDSQETLSKSLLHMLRNDLLNITDEIMMINRKRNTKSSKWYGTQARLDRYEILEEVMEECYASYTRLGGNHFIAEKYQTAKAIIKATQRQAER